MKFLLYIITLFTCFLIGCNEKLSIQQKIAKHYGIDNFNKIESVEYTWNVKTKNKPFSRTWKYNPNTKEVFYKQANIEKSWKRNNISKEYKKLDSAFINDQYWALFPFHLMWDSNLIFVIGLKKKAPISGIKYNWLRVSYPKGVGYTPGDAYELYYDDELNIHEWSYHKLGQKKISKKTTWENIKEVSGIKFTTEFKNKEGFKIWISDIKIVLKK
ncbi:MAG: hypothetical protein COB02_11255 [Candidatus Cloacimonadota bacterium]|nr:MAG: hypothetical protein COB02_11255 [Candidatus Cloacimonadota bacterium]